MKNAISTMILEVEKKKKKKGIAFSPLKEIDLSWGFESKWQWHLP